MVKGHSDVSESVDSVVHRLEDIEDNMQICLSNIDMSCIRLTSVESDIHLLEGSMDNAH
jgi:hypothetical protein